MNSEEKLEQSNIVKERGTVYFKVSQAKVPRGALSRWYSVIVVSLSIGLAWERVGIWCPGVACGY